MPTLILLGTFHFVIAANSTSSIILLAARDTVTLSILALEYASVGYRESAGIISILIMMLTVGVALVARAFGLRLGVRHEY
jgi:ABC-type Fe3+ transport system permease subunit